MFVGNSGDNGVIHESGEFRNLIGSGRTVRLGVKGIISRKGRVLLNKERRYNGTTFWTLPGGGVRSNETLREGLEREFREELNVIVKGKSIVNTCLYHHQTHPNLSTKYFIFDCKINGRPSPNGHEGIVDARWFEIEDLPDSTIDPFQQIISTVEHDPPEKPEQSNPI